MNTMLKKKYDCKKYNNTYKVYYNDILYVKLLIMMPFFHHS